MEKAGQAGQEAALRLGQRWRRKGEKACLAQKNGHASAHLIYLFSLLSHPISPSHHLT